MIIRTRKKNSYRIDNFREPAAEAARLISRAGARLDSLIPALQRLGLEPDMRVLDVGCGPGVRTLELARYLKHGHVLGIDTSETLLKKAEDSKARAGLNNVEFRSDDLNSRNLADANFDFAYMRLVLQHLSNPVQALRNIKRVLRPNGVLFVEETDRDWMMIYPFPRGWPEYYERVKKGQTRNGGDPHSGRKLPDYLRLAGFRKIESYVVPVHGSGEVFLDWLENYAPTFANNVSAIEAKAGSRLLQSIRRLNERAPIFLSQLWFQAAGRKL